MHLHYHYTPLSSFLSAKVTANPLKYGTERGRFRFLQTNQQHYSHFSRNVQKKSIIWLTASRADNNNNNSSSVRLSNNKSYRDRRLVLFKLCRSWHFLVKNGKFSTYKWQRLFKSVYDMINHISCMYLYAFWSWKKKMLDVSQGFCSICGKFDFKQTKPWTWN